MKSLEVPIKLDKTDEKPLYMQLYEQIKGYIKSGIFKEDYKLPTIRSFAKELVVNNVTIVNAYKLLEDDKLVYKKVGSGTYVMPLKENINYDIDDSMLYEDLSYEEVYEKVAGIIDFSTATPDSELFSIDDFRKVVDKVLTEDGGKAFMYHESKGYKPLRDSLSEHLKTYNVRVSGDNIYIISGAQQGIDIVSKTLLSNGDYVFVENPTYMGAVAAFKSRGAKIVEIPLLSDGLDMNELEKMLKLIKPKFIYVMPNFQNPTGYSYSERKMKYLLLLCKKYDVRIVEDDYLSDLTYLDIPSKPLKAFDKDNRVIYIKSFSKIFMPALRVAYVIIPDDLKDSIMNAKHVSDISTSGFMQRILNIYLTEGIWEKHIKHMKREYSLRYYEAVRGVKKCLRGASFVQPEGGLNLWIKLPEGVSSNELYLACKQRGVMITPGTIFLKGLLGEQYIRISFAAVEMGNVSIGISIIGEAMEIIKATKKISTNDVEG